MARRTHLRTVGIAAALTLALTAILPVTSAAADPVAKGKTRIELSRALLATLRADGVRLVKIRQGRVGGRIITLPVSAGQVDFGSGAGSLEHQGGFKLRAGRRAVSLTAITLDTAKRALSAKVDGKRLKIASLPSFGVERNGFGDEIKVEAVKLRAGAASLLDRKLHLVGAFNPTAVFASLSSNLQPLYDTIASGTLQFSLDEGTVAKLKTLGVEPVPFEVAAGPAPFSYSAPLIFGSIYPTLKAGAAGIEGGLRIEAPDSPGPVITWADLGLSLESNTVPANVMVHTESGQLAPASGGPIAALDLSGSTARVEPETRTVTITDGRATLEASAAELINETFAKPEGKAPVLAAGDPLGTFSLTMVGR